MYAKNIKELEKLINLSVSQLEQAIKYQGFNIDISVSIENNKIKLNSDLDLINTID